MRLTGCIHITPERTALNRGHLAVGIHVHTPHQCKVDHHATVADRMARDVVPARPDRNWQILRTCPFDRRDNILRIPAASNDARLPINHRVPDGTRVIKTGISGSENLSTKSICVYFEGVS
jgi:hypothetical protein